MCALSNACYKTHFQNKVPSEQSSLWKHTRAGYSTHLGDGNLGALVDQLHHIVGLALVRRYQETFGECTNRCRILLAHEAEVSCDQF